jgi:hypothetical protein
MLVPKIATMVIAITMKGKEACTSAIRIRIIPVHPFRNPAFNPITRPRTAAALADVRAMASE